MWLCARGGVVVYLLVCVVVFVSVRVCDDVYAFMCACVHPSVCVCVCVKERETNLALINEITTDGIWSTYDHLRHILQATRDTKDYYSQHSLWECDVY